MVFLVEKVLWVFIQKSIWEKSTVIARNIYRQLEFSCFTVMHHLRFFSHVKEAPHQWLCYLLYRGSFYSPKEGHQKQIIQHI